MGGGSPPLYRFRSAYDENGNTIDGTLMIMAILDRMQASQHWIISIHGRRDSA